MLKKINWIRRLYDWTLSLAEHKWSHPLMAFIAFIESSFFPIPADVLLIALSAAETKKAFKYALTTTVFSVLGGGFGYFIGFYFWDQLGPFFFENFISEEKFALVSEKFQGSAFLAVFVAGFTPIPYKVFTIAAGVLSVNFPIFIIASVFGRGMRFFAVSALFFFFGDRAKKWIDKHFDLAMLILGALVIIAAATLFYLRS